MSGKSKKHDPIAGIFGLLTREQKLRSRGIRVELYCLLLCVLIGFIMGLAYCPLVHLLKLKQFPTSEMVNRGQPRNLVTGVLVAIPSGAGVALGVLGGNSGSLVGVAISASLLPPAVNAGLLWALSFLLAVNPALEKDMIAGWRLHSNETLYKLSNLESSSDDFERLEHLMPSFQDEAEATWAVQAFALGSIRYGHYQVSN